VKHPYNPARRRFLRALSSDASRGGRGEVDYVRLTLQPGEFKAFPGDPAKLVRLPTTGGWLFDFLVLRIAASQIHIP
jgi:hypothetical protein